MSFQTSSTTSLSPYSSSADGLRVGPIACLPDDLLHEVFWMVASHPFVSGDTDSGSTGCIPLSHVCRYWRDVALASPQLWSFLYLSTRSNLAMLREFLVRSKNAPLCVRLSGPQSVWDPIEDIVRMAYAISVHTGRMLEFHAVGFLPDHMKAILLPFTYPAPQLRTLRLHAGAPMTHSAIFDNWMPLLRDVSVMEIAIPWSSYKGLTELILTDQTIPSSKEILWTLRNSPLLETLCLRTHGPMSDHLDDSESSPIELTRLRKLSLESTHGLDDVLHILSRLSFSQATLVDCRFHGRHYDQIDIGQYCSSMRAIASDVQHAYIQFMRTWDDTRIVVIKSTYGNIELGWQWQQDEDDDESRLENVGFAAMRFPALLSLNIHIYAFRLREDQWVDLFIHVSALFTMEIDVRSVHESTGHAFFRALSAVPVTNHETHKVVCPSLSHLIISRINDSEDFVWTDLVVCLRDRAKRGARRLLLLEITHRSKNKFPPELRTELGSLVDKVTICHRPLVFNNSVSSTSA
ncbi:hypothetical protein AcW1_006717 [Taiwanofungus camphoratus]|nr:hypothetical protein AcV7_007350 [Antrodia cinnamomea]KAI0954999.1 hypothetical protein AcW1_006717 [Antrodia cinnamomea]